MEQVKQMETRPFNLEHAKAGAPYACQGGFAATVLKWDANNSLYPLLGYVTESGHDYPENWAASGTCDPNGGDYEHRRNLVMTPLGYIEGRAFFVGDRIVGNTGEEFDALPGDKNGTHETWRWPFPAKQYPVIDLEWDDAIAAIDKMGPRQGLTITSGQIQAVANAALRHAIDNGIVFAEAQYTALQQQLIQSQQDLFAARDEVSQARHEYGIKLMQAQANGQAAEICAACFTKKDREARDMAIAEAVLEACQNRIGNSSMSAIGMGCIDLAAIIDKVPA
jgi:hypothetical protein